LAIPDSRVSVPIERSDDPAVVVVSGEVDLSNVDELVQALDRAISRHDHVTVHLADVTFMGLEGGRELVRAARRLPDRGRLYVVRPSAAVMRMMEILEASRERKLVLLPEC
jgi:anti-anti-sigma factor